MGAAAAAACHTHLPIDPHRGRPSVKGKCQRLIWVFDLHVGGGGGGYEFRGQTVSESCEATLGERPRWWPLSHRQLVLDLSPPLLQSVHHRADNWNPPLRTARIVALLVGCCWAKRQSLYFSFFCQGKEPFGKGVRLDCAFHQTNNHCFISESVRSHTHTHAALFTTTLNSIERNFLVFGKKSAKSDWCE